MDTSKIDAAIARARANKDGPTSSESIEDKVKRFQQERGERSSMKDGEREAKRLAQQAVLQKQRDERNAAREAKRALKAAELANKQPAHLNKVEKAAANLPHMSPDAQAVYDMAASLSRVDVEVLNAHLNLLARKTATIAATSTSVALKINQRVNIVGGPPKYIGKQGTVTKVQRIRCFVLVDGTDKEGYFFTSDVEPIVMTASAPVETETTTEETPSVNVDAEATPAA